MFYLYETGEDRVQAIRGGLGSLDPVPFNRGEWMTDSLILRKIP